MAHTVEIPRAAWPDYLDSVTRAMADAEVSIEGGEARDFPAGDLSLQFVAYFPREQLFEVAARTDAAHLHEVYHRLLEQPRRIAVDEATARPTRIEVEGSDGVQLVIAIEPER